jgi:hypothetical protein
VLIILLAAGWCSVPGRGETCTADPEARPGIPVPPAQFGNARHASAVHDFANQNYYQVMLAEMEKALFSAGYELTRMHHAAHGWQMQTDAISAEK